MHLMNDQQYMTIAMAQAAKAARLGEVPIGSAVVAKRPSVTQYSRIPLAEQEALLRAYEFLAAGAVQVGGVAVRADLAERLAADLAEGLASGAVSPGERLDSSADPASAKEEAPQPSDGLAETPDELVISLGYNRRELDVDPAGHAEFLALKEASAALGVWRLPNCVVYVTLEPCIMCAGLMHQARVGGCVFGAFDPKAGALGSLYRIHEDSRLNHEFSVTGGVLEQECAKMMKDFFAKRRKENKERKRAAAQQAALAADDKRSSLER